MRATAWIRDSDIPIALAFLLWSVAPIVVLLSRAHGRHESWGGAWAVLAPADQYRFLAWIRDAGDHVLISNHFGFGSESHVYLHPMFLLSGAAWKAGVSLQLAYVLWLPLAVAVLVLGWAAFIARTVEPAGWPRRAALVLALASFTPLLPALDWSGVLSADAVNHAVILAGQMAPYWQGWGYLATCVGLGLMAFYLVGLERLLGTQPPRRRVLVLTAAAGVGVSWLHPWGGMILLGVTVGLVIWDGFGARNLVALAPSAATAAPLLYYCLLSRSDHAWSLARLQASFDPGRPAWAFLFVLGLLLPIAAVGTRGIAWNLMDRVLVLWPVSALAVYLLVSPEAQLGAVEGISLPLGVLTVRGWKRLRLPAQAGVAALALTVVPGMLYSAQTMRDTVELKEVPYTVTQHERAALRYVAGGVAGGGVLSDSHLGTLVPAFTGRDTWAAQRAIDGRLEARAGDIEQLLEGGGSAQGGAELASLPSLRYVIDDCRGGLQSSPTFAPRTQAIRHFGCVTVYALYPGPRR